MRAYRCARSATQNRADAAATPHAAPGAAPSSRAPDGRRSTPWRPEYAITTAIRTCDLTTVVRVSAHHPPPATCTQARRCSCFHWPVSLERVFASRFRGPRDSEENSKTTSKTTPKTKPPKPQKSPKEKAESIHDETSPYKNPVTPRTGFMPGGVRFRRIPRERDPGNARL